MLTWAYIPYTLSLIIAGATALALGLYAARRPDLRGARPFMGLALTVAVWAIAYAFDVDSADKATKIVWSKIEYLGIATGPLFWLAFAVSYTRRSRWVSPRLWALLSLVPITTIVLVFTNEMHSLIWRAITFQDVGPFPTLRYEYGTWFWIHAAISYSWMLIGTALLLKGVMETPSFYRRQRLALLVGIFTPLVGNVLYVAKISPVPGLDLTPFAATLGAVAVALALFPFRLLDLVPVARRAMLDSMSEGVIALDTQGRIVDLNPAAQRIIGMTARAVIGQPAAQVWQAQHDLIERFRDVRDAHAEIARGPAGAVRHYDLRITSLLDGAGEYVGRLITLHDITERKEAQEEIQTLNAELEMRVEARTAELAAANQTKDATLRREQAARQDLAFLAEASRILAGSLKEAMPLSSLTDHVVPYLADGCAIHLLDDAGVLRRVAAAYSDPSQATLTAEIERRYPVSYPFRCSFPHAVYSAQAVLQPRVEDEALRAIARDPVHLALLRSLEVGSYICVPLVARERTLGALTLLRRDPGPAYNANNLALAEDLAQRAALALDNAQLYRTAQQAVQVREEFLTVASHELKTPLTSLLLAVRAVLHITRQDSLPPADYLTRRLTIVENQSKRLARLVENLLDISRISAGRLQLEPQEMDLAELTRETVAQFQEDLAEAHCEVTLRAGEPVRGYWDPARVEQVITNLLTNAMKYGRGKGINVTVKADGPLARLVVRDQGIGIAPEHLDRIFGRFERAVAPGKYSGMGLGLYITRQIVEAHGGRIGVTSTPGKGATFTVTLPIAPD